MPIFNESAIFQRVTNVPILNEIVINVTMGENIFSNNACDQRREIIKVCPSDKINQKDILRG